MAVDTRAFDLVSEGRITEALDVSVYEVEGFRERDYFVIVIDGYASACTCPAGMYGLEKCYHRQGVDMFLEMRDKLPFENDEDGYGY